VTATEALEQLNEGLRNIARRAELERLERASNPPLMVVSNPNIVIEPKSIRPGAFIFDEAGPRVVDQIHKRAVDMIVGRSCAIEQQYGWRKAYDEPADVVRARIEYDMVHNRERVVAAHRELQDYQDLVMRPVVSAAMCEPPRRFVVDASKVREASARQNCDCPGCAPRKQRRIEPRAEQAAFANAIAASNPSNTIGKRMGAAQYVNCDA
jgi:hypothetical protein